MPQVILLALIGCIAYLVYRRVRQRPNSVNPGDRTRIKRKSPNSKAEHARDAGDLIWDDKEGVYKTKDD